MAELTGMRVAVAGAGVMGLCTALRAAAAGASVDVWDPAAIGDNASGVAAGMIAPVGETLLEHSPRSHLELFLAGRAAWGSLNVLAPGLAIKKLGADFIFEEQLTDAVVAMLKDAGLKIVQADLQSSIRTRVLSTAGLVLHSSDDWLIDTGSGLCALAAAATARGVIFVNQRLHPHNFSAFDVVIVAAGMESRRFASLAPELALLLPIKGQLLRLNGGPTEGPVLRAPDVYLVPQAGGAIVGATMEIDRDDRIVDADALLALRSRLARWAPDLAALPGTGFAAVRAATPDGLPLVGRSSAPGLYLATGARRNGWLLAPLVSEIIVSYLNGGDGGAFAKALDPSRFRRV